MDHTDKKITDFYGKLDASKWFKPVILIIVAMCTGILLTPNVGDVTYPIDKSLIGKPSVSNIKAPRNIELEDNISVQKGEMIIRDGERFTPTHIKIFTALQNAPSHVITIQTILGGSVFLLVMSMTAVYFSTSYGRRRFSLHAREFIFLSVLFIGELIILRLLLVIIHVLSDIYPNFPMQGFVYILPLSASAIVVRLVLQTEVALSFALMHSLILGLFLDHAYMFGVYMLVGSVVAIRAIRTISSRSDMLRAGVWVGVAQSATAMGILLLDTNTSWHTYPIVLVAAFISGILSGFVALSMTPVVEWAFQYTTDLKLLELSNLNHPALKDLIVQAPGSYHHSILVGALVEAAATSVGANSLLARVMAYYHDLGKGCNPGYFIENQRAGNNPHDKLKPSMSAMIIRRHVTDGLDLAKRYGLGEPILAGIAEHHGTTLMYYFYHKAKDLAEENDQPISEADYRYPGRKPQSREAALVMLGDSIEAAARALTEPTPARLQGLVNRIISYKFTDGQLDECDLTLRDLHTIAKSFSHVLSSIYHHRLEYPDILKDISGKKHGDSDSKSSKKTALEDNLPEEGTADHFRRLGL